jgi:hypothetical protein
MDLFPIIKCLNPAMIWVSKRIPNVPIGCPKDITPP